MKQHEEIIESVLEHLNEKNDSPFILKGGTALMTCYGLDRHSEDIDLDASAEKYLHSDRELFDAINEFAAGRNYSVRIAKDTETVQRAMLHYGGEKPLKIELSLRRAKIPDAETTNIDGIRVYTLDRLCQMKAMSYLQRDKIRDLYDLAYILDENFEKLSDETIAIVRQAFEYKDLAQFDYLLETQSDVLVDKDLLADRFLRGYEKVGLMSTKDRKAHT